MMGASLDLILAIATTEPSMTLGDHQGVALFFLGFAFKAH